MATTLGWVLGKMLLPRVALVVSGYLIGFLQWTVLVKRMGKARQWILASIVGWSAGSFVYVFTIPPALDFLAGGILGAAVGIAQWRILRQEFLWAGWWIPVSVMAWTTGLTLLPGLLSTAVTAGAVTGIALELLLRSPRSAE